MWKIDERSFFTGTAAGKKLSLRLTRKVEWWNFGGIKRSKNYRLITQSRLYASLTRSVHLYNFVNSKRWMLLVVLSEVGVVFEGLVALFAEVDARLIVHERHVLPKIGRCFAHVIALPAAEWLWIHVNSVEIKKFSHLMRGGNEKWIYLMWTLNSPRCRNFKSHRLHSNFRSSGLSIRKYFSINIKSLGWVPRNPHPNAYKADDRASALLAWIAHRNPTRSTQTGDLHLPCGACSHANWASLLSWTLICIIRKRSYSCES